jgi:hypothetical protein
MECLVALFQPGRSERNELVRGQVGQVAA